MLKGELFGGRLTIGLFLGILNVIAFFAHSAFVILVIAVSFGVDESTGKPRDWVLLPTYRSHIVLKAGTNGTNFDASMLIPKYEIEHESGLVNINLTLLTIAFFALSAIAHLTIFVISLNSTLYLWWIARCRQPLRYA